jgi:hypothetical protein
MGSYSLSLRVLSVLRGFQFLPTKKKGAIHSRPKKANLKTPRARYRPPKPAVCIDCREMSAVEAIPCIRSLKSSAFEAFSSAVS